MSEFPMDEKPINKHISGYWKQATSELDQPNICQFGYMFSRGTPALPIEYGLRMLATQAQWVLSFEEMGAEVGLDFRPLLLPKLLDFHTRLNAALNRLQYYPCPTIPDGWPSTQDILFLKRADHSALAVAAKVLMELDEACRRWSANVLRYDSKTGRPSALNSQATQSDPKFIRWFEQTVSALRSVILSGCHTVDAVHLEANAVLVALESEVEQYRDAELKRKKRAEIDGMDHNDDFTWIRWGKREFEFTGQQAKVAKVLWDAMEKKDGPLTQKVIRDRIGSEAGQFELRKVFRRKCKGAYKQHPAWGSMIVQHGRGLYRLAEPEN